MSYRTTENFNPKTGKKQKIKEIGFGVKTFDSWLRSAGTYTLISLKSFDKDGKEIEEAKQKAEPIK